MALMFDWCYWWYRMDVMCVGCVIVGAAALAPDVCSRRQVLGDHESAQTKPAPVPA